MSCLIMTPQIREIAKSLNINPEECKDWIGYWQEQTGANLEAYPTYKELQKFIDSELQSAPTQEEVDRRLAEIEQRLSEDEWDWTYDDDRAMRALEDARMTFQAAEDTEDRDLIVEAAHVLNDLLDQLEIPTAQRTDIDLYAKEIIDREKRSYHYEEESEVQPEGFNFLEVDEPIGKDFKYDKSGNITSWKNKDYVVKQFKNPKKLINNIALAVVKNSKNNQYGIVLYNNNTSVINYVFYENDSFYTKKPNSNYIEAVITNIEVPSAHSKSPRITVRFYDKLGRRPGRHIDERVFNIEQFYNFLNDDRLFLAHNFTAYTTSLREATKIKELSLQKKVENLRNNINETPEGRKLIEQIPNIKITANRPGQGTIQKPYKVKMSSEFNNEKRPTVKGRTTLEAIINGQRIATTIYKSDGHLDGWKQMKRGDIIEFTDNDRKIERVVVVNPLHQLTDTSHDAARSWSNKEGWSMNRFNTKVKGKIQDPNDEAWQIEFLPLDFVEYEQKTERTTLVSPTASEGTEAISTQTQTTAEKKGENKSFPVGKTRRIQPALNLKTFRTKVNPISNITRRKVDEIFRGNIQKKRDRINLISSLFSEKVSMLLDQEEEDFNNAIRNAEDQRTKSRLQAQYKGINRFYIIKKNKPVGIFLEIYNELRAYANEEDPNTKDVKNPILVYSEDEERGEERDARVQAFKEITDDLEVFKALAEDACRILRTSEMVDIDTQSIGANEVTNITEGQYKDNIDNIQEQVGDEPVDDRHISEGWGENVRNISSKDSLSRKTRQAISLIPRTDSEGEIDYDDLGFVRYLNADEVHTTLNQILMHMTEPQDMIPMLKNYSQNNPWANRLVEILEEDEEVDGSLTSQFYTDFRKNFLNYGIQLWQETESGAMHYKTVALNLSEGVSHLLDRWRSTYESGSPLNREFSIYDKQGKVNSEKSKENAAKGRKAIQVILQRLGGVERNTEFGGRVPAIQKLLQDEDIQRNITVLCQMVGINTAPETIIKALSYSELVDSVDEKNNPIKLPTYPKVREFLNDINIILTGVEKGKISDMENADGTITHGDLINSYRNAYIGMAKIISKIYNKSVVESSIRQNGESYYSHIVPNFLTDLVKELQNSKGLDGKIYVQNLEKKYGHCEWFKKNGEWMCDWIRELINNPQSREQLEHVQELSFGGIEYSQLSGLQYTVGLMARYWSNPNPDYAWYHVPIMSNADSAEFIKFKRIHGTNWKDKLLTKFVNVVAQEYNRIKLVAQRNAKDGTREIGNFDKRGLEFCFFPALNDKSKFSYPVLDGLGVQQVDINGKLETRSFFEQLDYLYRNDKTKVEDFVKGEIEKLLDEDFEKALKDWHKLGIFKLTDNPNGRSETKYKYIPYSFSPGSALLALEALKGNGKEKGAKELLEGLNLWTPQMEEALKTLERISSAPTYYNYEQLIGVLNNIEEILQNIGTQLNLSKSSLDAMLVRLHLTDSTRDGLMEYFYNSVFATSQIIELTTTDLAFYKNLADFQKRFKEVHSPALRLNTLAKFHGETIGREFEKSIYIKDEEIVSTIVEAYKDLLEKQYKEGKITAYTYASMMAKYGYSNYEVETDKLVESIDPKTGEKKLIPQKIKYWKITETNPNTRTSKDILVKTSKVNVTDAQAYRCLSSYRAVSGMIGDWTDEKEEAYNQIIDGSYRPGSLKASFNTIKGFAYAQVDQIIGHDNAGNPIWGKIPTQHKNSELLILTAYKAVAGELGASADPNSKVAKAVNKLKVINAFMEANGIDVVQFESAVKVGDQGVIDINNATSEDEIEQILNEATKMEHGGDPTVVHTIPYANYGIQQATPDHFFDTSQVVGTQIRRLITSDISPEATFDINGKELTKAQWLKEYNALINQNVKENFEALKEELSHNENIVRILQNQLKSSDRYASELLKAVTLDENGEFVVPLFEPSQARRTQELLTSIFRNQVTKQKTKGGSLIQATEYGLTSELKIKFKNDDPAQGIEYIECYMPATSKVFFEAYMNRDGTIDIDKIPEKLRRAIGYRIPTEDKYSMAPLRIKGFLPQENGGVIMLPAEITTISGSDFDIDKLYIMLQNFEIHTNEDGSIDLERIEYNVDETPNSPENTKAARDNRIFDLMWAQLTHPDTVTKLLNPGGFDQQKIASRVCTLLSVNDSHSLRELLVDTIKDLDIDKIKDEKELLDYLFSLDIPTLDTLIDSSEEEMNPLSPRTQVVLQQQNMNAANLIGIYANHNTSSAVMQQTSLALSSAGSFIFNGKRLTSLHSIKNPEGEYISRNTAGYLALAVDDTKERLLYGINQNTFTADVTMLLSRLGYSPIEIGILLNSPIVKEITTEYYNNRGFKTKTEIIDGVLKKYQKLGGLEGHLLTYSSFKDYKFPIESLASEIMMSNLDSKPASYYRDQMAVGYLFKQIMKSAGALTDLVNLMKIDSSKNGAGPLIADMEDKVQKVELFTQKIRRLGDKFPLSGAIIIETGLTDEEVEKSLIPGIQTFFTYGIERPLKELERFFPYAASDINTACNVLGQQTSRGEIKPETRNSIYNEFLAYVLSNNPVFKGEDALETRRQFIHHFPDYFREIVKDPKNAKDLEGNEFINNLSERAAKKGTRLKVLTLQQAGSLTSKIRDEYIADWEALLYSNNPALRELAVNLGRYCYFRSGMGFGSTSFAHLMPVAVREAIPEYLDTLRYMIDPQRSSYDITPFIQQYVRNHLDNTQLVTYISSDENIQFTEKGSVKDEIAIKVDPNVPSIYNKICLDPEDDDPLKYTVTYISTQINGQPIYYMLDMGNDTPPNELVDGITIAHYKRIEPLGKNMFLEYEFGKNAWEVESAIPYILIEDSSDNSDMVNSESHDFKEDPDDERIDDDYTIPNTTQFEDNIMQEAFRRVFDQSLNYVERIPQDVAFNSNDMGDSTYTDAEDNIIC